MLFGLLACTDQSAGSAPSLKASPAAAPARGTQIPVADVATAIQDALFSDRNPALGLLTPAERKQLSALYSVDAFAPLWVEASGRPNRDAHDALALLDAAADEGLDPADYHAHALDALATALEAAPAPRVSDIAAFDAGLSANTLRYLQQLHNGRVDPRAIGFRMTAPRDDDDFAALLRSALTGHRITGVAAELTPPFALYRALRGMLARYRSLAADPTLENLLLPPTATSVKPGKPYAALDTLRRLLVALGDLPADAPASSEPMTYDGAIVEGVKHFQMRHGLDADGALGKATQAALRVPLAWRARQIELALERLRWLPHLGTQRFIAVNIPMFHLWGWDSIPADGAPAFGMGVIVGRALNTQSPVFVEEMQYLIFRPYWNVPTSILRHETLPAIERDPDYLRKQDMEIVAGPGDDARPVELTAETLAQLRQGRLRVRQRPGPKNSLGLVKFVFPNDDNVYMHGTPAPQLFRHPRRDFSHGCVRVEDPVALAEWALDDQNEWSRDRILEAMNTSHSLRVNLARPIQVILFYVTAVVMPEDGTIRFAEDIYGHDARLDRALTRRGATR
jgi:murein L,D-transpeptidase YcbB/YkuD